MEAEIHYDKVTNPGKTLKRLWGYLKKEKGRLLWIIILVIISTIASICAPLFMAILIDQFIAKSNMKGFLFLLCTIAVLYIIVGTFRFFINFIMARISESSLFQLRQDLFYHLQDLSLKFFDQNPKGDIMSRFTNDVSIIDDSLSDAVVDVISSVITLIGVTIMMFTLNVPMAIITIITVPIFFFIVAKIGQKASVYFSKQQEELGQLNSYAEEMISSMKVIKSYNKEKHTVEMFDQKNRILMNTSIKAQLCSNLVMPANMLISNMNHILLIGLGAILTLNGHATVGAILAFLNYSNMFRQPINELASLYASIQASLAGAERIFEVIDHPIDVKDVTNPLPFETIKGDVTLENVNFSYVKDKPILKNITIHAHDGKHIAIVGPTGAGKTTIINLLTRFYDIDSGLITIDQIDITKVKKQDLRKKIGIVLQDTYLFKGTVKDNLRYGKLDATEEEMIEACKKAQAHSFLHRLPNGYDSFVEEEGANFSQGERQLIAIARAFLSNPDILILDEATSNVDTRTEMAIQKGMNELMEGRTCFVIAHRLSTIENADQILVLIDGEIKEMGTHQELLKQNGFYNSLYKSQFEAN